MKIAICFFGITRSLRDTAESIRNNVIEPIRQLGDVTVYAHYFDQPVIHNLRTREINVTADASEYKVLDYDHLLREAPDACLKEWDFTALKAGGDAWGDGFSSLRNHVHQLASIRKVWRLAMQDGPDIVVYLRPDMLYHDNFGSVVRTVIERKLRGIVVPDWQWWWGVNDRLAICCDRDAIDTYGRRIELAKEYIAGTGRPIHAEQLLKYCLDLNRVVVTKTHLRASRVRANGRCQEEDFVPSTEAFDTPSLKII
jgi:hypothetical protein